MTGLIHELQKECFDGSDNPLSIIRKAYTCARKLKLSEMAEWLDHEMKGYEKRSQAPKYRHVHGVMYGTSIYGPIPVQMPSSLLDQLTIVPIAQPISEIIAIVRNENSHNVQLPFQGDLNKKICDLVGQDSQFYIEVGKEQLKAIVDAVIDSILNWALLFEENGILGDGLSFSSVDLEKAKAIPSGSYCPVIVNGNIDTMMIQTDNNNSKQDVKKDK